MWPGCARPAAAFSLPLPCPVRVFADADLEDARRLVIGITGTMRWSGTADVIERPADRTHRSSSYQQHGKPPRTLNFRDCRWRKLLLIARVRCWAGLGPWGATGTRADQRRTMRRVVVVGNKGLARRWRKAWSPSL